MSHRSGFSAGPARALVLGLLVLSGCAEEQVSAPESPQPEFAAGDFSGKKLQLTNGSVCGAALPRNTFDQSLDEDINAVMIGIPGNSMWTLSSSDPAPVDLGGFQFICSTANLNFFHLVSAVSGTVGRDLSAGDLPVGRYTLRVEFGGRVLGRARFEVVP